MSDYSDMEYSSDNECYDDYYNTGKCPVCSVHCLQLSFNANHSNSYSQLKNEINSIQFDCGANFRFRRRRHWASQCEENWSREFHLRLPDRWGRRQIAEWIGWMFEQYNKMCPIAGKNSTAGASLVHKWSGHKISWECFRIVGTYFVSENDGLFWISSDDFDHFRIDLSTSKTRHRRSKIIFY